MTVFFSFSWFAKQFDNLKKKFFLEIFDFPGILIMNISLWKSGICCIDNFNLSAVNDYEKCFKIVTRKISFQIFTKFCRWNHQTTSPIGDSMESKVFDELLLIEVKITIRNLLEKNLWFTEENHWSCRIAAGRADDGKRAKSQWQVLYIWRMIDQSLKTTNFQWFSKKPKVIILNQSYKPTEVKQLCNL